MANGLFYCVPRKISLGSNALFHINWLPKQSLEMNLRLCASRDNRDEFGDAYSEIDIEYLASVGVPAVELRYQHQAGNTGFEFFSKNEYGNLPDSEAKELADWLLRDAWTWSSNRHEFISYENERSNLSHPLDFLLHRVKGRNAIAVHAPYSLSAVEELVGFLEGNLDFPSILSIVAQSKMVSIWQPAYGENPVLLSSNMSDAFTGVAAKCTEMGLSLHKVESQSDLPEW